MTTEEMELICELPNYSSFLDASGYLPYSPSTIAKYVANVEAELGVRFFVRSNKTRGLALTEEGKVLIEALRRMNDDWGYVKKQAGYLKNADSEKLRIGSQPRFGNIHEQRIIAQYLFAYPTIQLNMTKAPADDLIRSLISGKLDAAFITFNDSLDLKEYFSRHGDKLTATQIVSEKEMYAGVSEQYFRGRDAVCLKELAQFTFAFPFPKENDLQSALAMQSWKQIAAARGIELKYIHLQGYDSTVFEMARQKRIAVTTTHIPTAKYAGVRFLKLSDWSGGTRLYFLRRPTNRSNALLHLEACVRDYTDSIGADDRPEAAD